MKILKKLRATFSDDESGAVTVDWVVLTAAIAGFGVVVLATVGNGTGELSGDVKAVLNSNVIQSGATAVNEGGGDSVVVGD